MKKGRKGTPHLSHRKRGTEARDQDGQKRHRNAVGCRSAPATSLRTKIILPESVPTRSPRTLLGENLGAPQKPEGLVMLPSRFHRASLPRVSMERETQVPTCRKRERDLVKRETEAGSE